jgi:hypothetical protein
VRALLHAAAAVQALRRTKRLAHGQMRRLAKAHARPERWEQTIWELFEDLPRPGHPRRSPAPPPGRPRRAALLHDAPVLELQRERDRVRRMKAATTRFLIPELLLRPALALRKVGAGGCLGSALSLQAAAGTEASDECQGIRLGLTLRWLRHPRWPHSDKRCRCVDPLNYHNLKAYCRASPGTIRSIGRMPSEPLDREDV